MAFYKKDTELQVAPEFVYAPEFTLKAEAKDTYEYPVGGWYWFDTLDDAINFYAVQPVAGTLTPRQARLILLQYGLLDDIEAMIATDRALGIWWEYSLEIKRDDERLIVAASALGLTDEQLDEMFIEASKL